MTQFPGRAAPTTVFVVPAAHAIAGPFTTTERPNCLRTLQGSAHMTCARRDDALRLATSAPRRGATADRAEEGSVTGARAVRRTPSRPS